MEEQNSGYDSTKKQGGNGADNFEDQAKKSANEFKEGWNQATHTQENKKILAGILAIVIGSLGIHKFILGYTQEGIIQIVITFVTCGIGGIIPLIEGIIYLTKSDEEFYQTYQVGKKGWF
ncbi:TM2 domain-containing protein [Aequorivita marina]|uniref:TM2 domain-containing protein n=1 Tax=Aequorivita marina TaxID=3073654 RepID=UPI0028747CC1|nr:TM2 domain-containing protein [Aequorivita sp. S2608]MDS1299013.1 TM2 domain-containing protein [Aequorivita sp. S2608]